MPVKIVTWNVNSLRSVLRKNFLAWLKTSAPDIICLQEVRAKLDQLRPIESLFEGYQTIWHPAVRSGYAGTAILSRFEPVLIEHGLAGDVDLEGRALTADFGDFRVGSFYAPNATADTPKIPIKCAWLNQFQKHISNYSDKPFIIAGDLNVAHIKFDSGGVPHPLHINGCTDEERESFQSLLDKSCLHDPIRNQAGTELLSTWWHAGNLNRNNSNGIRCDYVLIQTEHSNLIQNCAINSEIDGSDHCPISLTVNFQTNNLLPAKKTGQKNLF